MKSPQRSPLRLFSFGFIFLFLFLGVTFLLPLSVSAAPSEKPVSPALYVLAEEHAMAKASLRGNAISFEQDDFARAVNLSSVSAITVTELPPITDGELRLGKVVVQKGQTIRGSNLSLLSYVPSNAQISTSSFRFTVETSPVEIPCHLYLLEKTNSSPTLSTASELALNVSTHQNVTFYGTLPCYDPDGDQTIVEIVSYPKNGILHLSDRFTGEYTYTPRLGDSGKESFTYVARDVYGNYSASETVSLSIIKPSSSTVYSDLIDSPICNAAISMTDVGIMSGTQRGTAVYFCPDESVSREDFVVMAMKVMGMKDFAPVSKTVFADDAEISSSAKSAIDAAFDLGYIRGEWQSDGSLCFAPDRAITRAESAVIVGRMLNVSTPTAKPNFSDANDIPAWAAPSMESLSAAHILHSVAGEAEPYAVVTRGDAARILAAMMQARH